MLGSILLSLFATGVGIAQATAAEAESTPVLHGTCGSGGCYVEMEGPHHGGRLIRLDEQIADSNDPCHIYQCTTRGVIEDRLECDPIITCQDGSQPVGFPDTCCSRCIGSRQHEVCSFTQWGEWGRCSVPCGGGRKARVRHPVYLPESAISIYCSGSLNEIQECNPHACPVDCKWEYGQFGECSASCGTGTKTRYPIITQRAQNGGRPCPRNRDPDIEKCILQPCTTADNNGGNRMLGSSAQARFMAKLLEKYYEGK